MMSEVLLPRFKAGRLDVNVIFATILNWAKAVLE